MGRWLRIRWSRCGNRRVTELTFHVNIVWVYSSGDRTRVRAACVSRMTGIESSSREGSTSAAVVYSESARLAMWAIGASSSESVVGGEERLLED